jgi:hypothetical protein
LIAWANSLATIVLSASWSKLVFTEFYVGEHLRLKTLAAIKIVHTQLADDDAAGIMKVM